MNKTPSVGYSGTPLAKKLGIKQGSRLLLVDSPPDFVDLLQPLPGDVIFESALSYRTDITLVFALRRDALKQQLAMLRKQMRADATVWVCWPKKASNMATEITEDVIRELALPPGLVDIKVCAVSEIWSGLKLVVRKELR